MNSVVLLNDELQLILVHFKFFLLQQHNLGLIGNISTKTRQTFGLSDQSQNVSIKVNKQTLLAVLWGWVSDQKCC